MSDTPVTADVTPGERGRVEVFQPRLIKDDDHPDYEALRDLRTGMGEPEDLSFNRLTELYELVGGDTVRVPEPESDAVDPNYTVKTLERVFREWNNGSGGESDAFRRSNRMERAVSLSSGHIVRIEGTAFLCAPFGWTHLPAFSF